VRRGGEEMRRGKEEKEMRVVHSTTCIIPAL
jgi:hypothetical protein